MPKTRRITPIDHRMLLRLCRAELALARGNQRVALAQAKAGLAELGRMRDRLGGLELVSGTAVHGRELGELAVRLVLGGRDSAADVQLQQEENARAMADLLTGEGDNGTSEGDMSKRRPGADLGQQIDRM